MNQRRRPICFWRGVQHQMASTTHMEIMEANERQLTFRSAKEYHKEGGGTKAYWKLRTKMLANI